MKLKKKINDKKQMYLINYYKYVHVKLRRQVFI